MNKKSGLTNRTRLIAYLQRIHKDKKDEVKVVTAQSSVI